MKRFLRLPWFVLLVLLAFWLLLHIPGYTRPASDQEATFSLGKLVVDLVDPRVLLVALGAALVVGRWNGARAAVRFLLGLTGPEDDPEPNEARASVYMAASRTLAAGARGVLWGAFLLNAMYLLSFYWLEPPGLLADYSRVAYVKAGAIPAVLLGCLLLLPCAERAAELSGHPESWTTRVARAVDVVALTGLFVCSLAVILSAFVYRAEIIGVPGSGQSYVAPTWGGVDAPFVLWSLGITIFVPWVALLPTMGAGAITNALRYPGQARSGALFQRIARSSFAVGILAAVLVETAGLHQIAVSGGNANPAELQSVGGCMLLTALCGLLVATVFGLGPSLVAKRRAAPDPAPEAT